MTSGLRRWQQRALAAYWAQDRPPEDFLVHATPGAGKTRLALEAAEAQLDRFEHGVYFVPLAPLPSGEQILTALANALHFTFVSGQEAAAPPREQLADFLRPKKMLLVLDNCEHVRDGLTGTGAAERPQRGTVGAEAAGAERVDRLDPDGGLRWLRTYGSDDLYEYGDDLLLADDRIFLLGRQSSNAGESALVLPVDYDGRLILDAFETGGRR